MKAIFRSTTVFVINLIDASLPNAPNEFYLTPISNLPLWTRTNITTCCGLRFGFIITSASSPTTFHNATSLSISTWYGTLWNKQEMRLNIWVSEAMKARSPPLHEFYSRKWTPPIQTIWEDFRTISKVLLSEIRRSSERYPKIFSLFLPAFFLWAFLKMAMKKTKIHENRLQKKYSFYCQKYGPTLQAFFILNEFYLTPISNFPPRAGSKIAA